MKTSILLYLIVVLLAVITYSTFHSGRDKRSYKDLNKQIDSLEVSIETNDKVIQSYDVRIQTIKDSVITLDKKVQENNKKIKKLDEEYEQRFDSISNFYGSELQEYVAKRYKDK
jgi:peptidoglycan hydrolase CwlO-like protein